jgi:type II secretory pathway component PulF
MKALFNTIAILSVGVAHILIGILVSFIGRVHASLFEPMEMSLPLISQAAINYTASTWPLYLGVAVGVGSVVSLYAISRSETARWMLPFLLSVSFVAALLHLSFVAYAVALPSEKILSSMSE